MAGIGKISVDLEARLAKFESDIGRAARLLEREMSKSARQTERAINNMQRQISRDMDRIRSSAKGAATAVAGFFTIRAGAQFARELARVADNYSNIQSRVRLAAGENANLADSIERIAQVSNRTYQSLDGTSRLVQRTAQAFRGFGQNSSDAFNNAIKLSEVFNKALVISGASQQEATASAIQFSQAIASGRLAGDEFRSVLENNSRFAQLLADSLGTTIGGLYELRKAGKLGVDALLGVVNATASLEAEFQKIPVTISRSVTQLENAWTLYVGQADQAAGSSRNVAEAIQFLAANIDPIVSTLLLLGETTAAVFGARAISAIAAYIGTVRASVVANAEQAASASIAAQQTLFKARGDQVGAEAAAAAAAAELAKAEATFASTTAQTASIRVAGLKATSEIQLARLSLALTQADTAQAAATAALGAARTRLVGVNATLVASNRALAAAQANVASTSAAAATAAATGAGAVARFGAGLLSFVGGPVGATVIGLGALSYGLYKLSQDGSTAQEGIDLAADAIDRLEEATAGTAPMVLELARASREQARASLEAAKAELERRRSLVGAIGNRGRDSGGLDASLVAGRAQIEVEALAAQIDSLNGKIAEMEDGLANVASADMVAATLNQIATSGGNASEASEKFNESLEKQILKMQQSVIEQEKGVRAALLFEAVQAQGLRTADDLSDTTLTLINRLTELTRANEAAKRATREKDKADRAAEKAASDLERAQQRLADIVDSINSKDVDAATKAWNQYSKVVRDIAAQGAKMIQSGRSVAATQHDVATAVDAASAALKRALVEADSYTASLTEAMREAEDEIAVLSLSGQAREELIDKLDMEAEIRQATSGWTEDQIKLYQEEIEKLRELIKERQRLQAHSMVSNGLSSTFSQLGTALGQGENAFASFAMAGVEAFGLIAQGAERADQSIGDFVKDFGKKAEQYLPVVQQFANAVAAASPQGSGASRAAGAVSGAIAGYQAFANTVVLAPYAWVGAILGGLAGFFGSGGGDDEKPQIRIDTGGLVNGFIPEATREGPFGAINVHTRGPNSPPAYQVAEAIQDFDRQIATFLDQNQIETATDALRNFSFTSPDGVANVQDAIEERFEVVSRAVLGDTLGRWIEQFSNDLNAQMQAFADIVSFQRLAEAGQLFSGTVEETVALMDKLRMGGESLGQTFQRLAEAVLQYADVSATAEEEILTGDLSDFQRSVLDVQRLEIRRMRALEDSARAAGNLVPREEDLIRVRRAAAESIARLTRELRMDAMDRAAELYGRSISDIDAELRALRDAQETVTETTAGATAALQDFGAEMQRAREIASATLQFGGLKGQELADFALDALGRGEISLDQALQAGQKVYASGSDFNDFFAQAVSIFRNLPERGDISVPGAPAVVREREITAEEQALLDERAALVAEDEARRRLNIATELAQNIADLANIQDIDYGAVLGDLNIDPDRLAADLGIDLLALEGYLDSLVAAFPDDLAQILEDLPEAIARAMFDVMREGIPALGEGALPFEPIEGPGVGTPPPGSEGPPGIIKHAEKLVDIEVHTGESVALQREMRDLLAGIHSGTLSVVDRTGRTVMGIDRLADGAARSELDRLTERPRSSRRRSEAEA